MKKMNHKIAIKNTVYIIVPILLLVLLSISCSEEDLEENPPNVVVAEELFVDPAGFETALNGLYHEVRKERMGSTGADETAAGDIRFSLMVNGTDNVFGLNPGPSERLTNDYGDRNNSGNGYIERIFNWLYRTINAANTIVNRAQNTDIEWTEAQKNEVVAEARTIRAWAYRHLTYLWGDVPINLEESSGSTIRTDWERAPVMDVYKVMEEDLLYAEEWLPSEARNAGTVTKAVAQHYLSEVYLLMNQPDLAEEKAKAVIDGPYALITERYGVRESATGVPFMDQFYDGNVLRSQGNTEVLWAILQENGTDNPEQGRNIMRRYFIGLYREIPGIALSEERGGRGIGRMSMTNWALSIYEPTDDRNSEFAITKGYTYGDSDEDDPTAAEPPAAIGDVVPTQIVPENTITGSNRIFYPHCRKWEWADPSNLELNEQYGDQPYLRLADTYLLLAEAQFKQGKTGDAAETINVVRRRSNASEITSLDVNIDFILDERSREFLCEEQRRYCLVRNDKLVERTQLYNLRTGSSITERDTVFPIPQDVIDANLTREMRQNPGY